MTEAAVSNDEFTAFWNNVLAAKFEHFRNILLEFQLALGPAGEIFREAGALAEKRRPEIESALRAELARHQRDDKIYMRSGSWTITARKPA
jgi:hypothetical protein